MIEPPLPPTLVEPRREGLNRAELIELLEEQQEEAQRTVKLSLKKRYLRSFREFLGMGCAVDP